MYIIQDACIFYQWYFHIIKADQLKDPAFYPEASDYLEEYIREHKLAEYLTLIKEELYKRVQANLAKKREEK